MSSIVTNEKPEILEISQTDLIALSSCDKAIIDVALPAIQSDHLNSLPGIEFVNEERAQVSIEYTGRADSNPNFSRLLKVVSQNMQRIAEKICLNNWTDIVSDKKSPRYLAIVTSLRIMLDVVNDSSKVPSAGQGRLHNSACITIPYTFLLQSEDVEEVFKEIKLDRDALEYTSAELLQIHNGLQRYLGLVETPLSLKTRCAVGMFLEFIKNPDLSEKAKIFVLGHELGHIAYNHSVLKAPKSRFIKVCKASRMPNLIQEIALIKLTRISRAVHANREFYCERERQADAVSKTLLKDEAAAEGGIYLFSTLLNVGKELRGKSLFYRLVFDKLGGQYDYEHPSIPERIAYLSNVDDDNVSLKIKKEICDIKKASIL